MTMEIMLQIMFQGSQDDNGDNLQMMFHGSQDDNENNVADNVSGKPGRRFRLLSFDHPCHRPLQGSQSHCIVLICFRLIKYEINTNI